MQLKLLAKEMYGRLDGVEKGHISRVLFGGLIVVLERRGPVGRLAIGRQGSTPSKTEADVIARDFAAPAGVEWAWTQRTKRQSGAKITYNIAECLWQTDSGDTHENDCHREQ